jgi:beta-RFAP synthase
MIRVQTSSRLHFGLLSLPSGACWPDRDDCDTLPARCFGGVGLMVQQPGVRLTVQPALTWSAEGPLAERALTFARCFAQSCPAEVVTPHHVIVEACAPEHTGLGTGTQLALAVARALSRSFGLTLDAIELARRVGRGRRSALGIHGFARGGFLVEAGQRTADTLAPLVAHMAFPESWRVVLVLPAVVKGLHGPPEVQAFQHLLAAGQTLTVTEALCRLVLLGMLPALAEADFPTFGEAVYDFNRRVGEVFAPVQGGTYAGAHAAELVAFVRHQGVRGVGQSSWGPTVFAVIEDEEKANNLVGQLRQRFVLSRAEVMISAAQNHGEAAAYPLEAEEKH